MRRARPLLGTIVEIALSDDDGEDVAEAAFAAAFAVVERVQRLMSFHDEHSDVSAINRAQAGEMIAVDRHTYTVLEFAREISHRSAGAFDICVASVLIDNAFLPMTDSGKRDAAANYTDLELLPDGRLRWKREGQVDLGGIAKGYAVDSAVSCLRGIGLRSGVVNAGGDLRCFGEPQAIYLRHPFSPGQLLHAGQLADAAIATSAGYFSDQPERDPLVDTAGRCCVQWNGSISVVADRCMVADALTKVVRLNPDLAVDLLAEFAAQAIAVDEGGVRSCGRARLILDA